MPSPQFQFFDPRNSARPNYQPWLQGEAENARAKAAAAQMITDALNRMADRKQSKEERQSDRDFASSERADSEAFQANENKKTRDASATEGAANRDLSREQVRAQSDRSFDDRMHELVRDEQKSRLNLEEDRAKAEMERSIKEERARQFASSVGLAKRAMWDPKFTPIETVKGVTLAGHMDELRSQGADLPKYLGSLRDPEKSDGLLKLANEPKDVKHMNPARSAALARTISERTGVAPDVAAEAVRAAYGGVPEDFESAMKARVEGFNKARGIEAPVRQQQETGSITDPKVSAVRLTSGQKEALESFAANGGSPRQPLSSDFLAQTGLTMKDIQPGAGATSAGLEDALKRFTISLDDKLDVKIEGPGGALGDSLRRVLTSPVARDKVVGAIAGGPANSSSDMEKLGSTARAQRDAAGAPASPAQKTAVIRQGNSGFDKNATGETKESAATSTETAPTPKASTRVNEWLFGKKDKPR